MLHGIDAAALRCWSDNTRSVAGGADISLRLMLIIADATRYESA